MIFFVNSLIVILYELLKFDEGYGENVQQKGYLAYFHKFPFPRYAELTHCWAKEPNKRPHFKTLHDRLGNLDSLAGGDVNMGFEHDAETSSQQPDTDVTVDVEQTSNEDNTEVDDHPTETDAHLTEENASRISSEVYDDIGEEDVTVEVEPTKMSDDNMVF